MDTVTAYRRRWGTLAVLSVSLFVIGLDNTILNVALPSLARSLDATSGQLQWMVDSYTLVFAGLLLSAGSLGDRFGRRRALFLGLAVFGAASLWAAWSGSAEELIIARAVMGIGGAFIMPSTLSVLTNSFPDSAERARAIGIWAAVSGIGVVLGPTLGGWLLQYFWWGSIFLVNVPVVAAGMVAGRWLVPESRDPASPRIDIVGAIVSIIGLITLVWSIIEAPSRGWTSTVVLSGFALAAVMLVAFAVWELRAAEPMLNLAYFRNPRFSAASVSVTLLFFSLFGTVFCLSQYLQFVLGYTALEAGERTLPIATMVIGAPIGGWLVRRIGYKGTVATGLLTLAVAMVTLSGTTTASGYGRVGAVLALFGFGMGLAMAPATDAIMGVLPRAKAGVGSAVADATRQVGGALGVAVLGSILSSAYDGRLGDTFAGRPVPEPAKEGIGGALAAAARLPGDHAAALTRAARAAFVHGMDRTVLAAAVVMAVGALVALLWLPVRGREAMDPDLGAENRAEIGTDTDAEAQGVKAAGPRRLEPIA